MCAANDHEWEKVKHRYGKAYCEINVLTVCHWSPSKEWRYVPYFPKYEGQRLVAQNGTKLHESCYCIAHMMVWGEVTWEFSWFCSTLMGWPEITSILCPHKCNHFSMNQIRTWEKIDYKTARCTSCKTCDEKARIMIFHSPYLRVP